MAKVEFHAGELFPRLGFIVASVETGSRTVVGFCNKRGTAEQWIKEGKQAVKMTRLSCHRFRSNQARLSLTVIAYNLRNLWRRLVLPLRVGNWSLTSVQQRLVKTGGRLIQHARYYWLLLAEGQLAQQLLWPCCGGLPRCRCRRDSPGRPEPRASGLHQRERGAPALPHSQVPGDYGTSGGRVLGCHPHGRRAIMPGLAPIRVPIV